jgi:hypothetical protein
MPLPSGGHARLQVTVLNPLQGGLRHYTEALIDTLSRAGAAANLIEFPEPSQSGQPTWRWLAAYCRALAAGRRGGADLTIVTWPVVGYFDVVLIRLFLPSMQTCLIIHDPHPLVHAVGYGRLARWLAGISQKNLSVIVHSRSAEVCVLAETRLHDVVQLSHPVMRPEELPTRHLQVDLPVVRVIGQYKASRDLDALRRLAVLAPRHWRLEVIGRDWPPLQGWEVRSEFVSEQEFDALVDSSSVILIPYREFFQSGVALRALERNCPVVGPADSSLGELLGPDSQWLVRDGDWLRAISAANSQTESAEMIVQSILTPIVDAWAAWSRQQRTPTRAPADCRGGFLEDA